MLQALRDVNGKQPGDVVKGCAVTFDVLTRTGIAEGKAVPVRIVLGTDADAFIRNKISSTLGILEDWKGPIHSTDHDDVAPDLIFLIIVASVTAQGRATLGGHRLVDRFKPAIPAVTMWGKDPMVNSIPITQH
ncbi:hypothetical protein NLG97_g10093 [Lecanicillium saksenae]|uniref:Uncharacterized protein n=1 Tax=Lecanicillium saksenae TaxID=468837 RepID=A0ACC1QEF1_9HYPO|nr:hypothetical protein NLG97_g10093 [Lecanicillium saksenae]